MKRMISRKKERGRGREKRKMMKKKRKGKGGRRRRMEKRIPSVESI